MGGSQVTEPVLRKVIEWCEHHRNDPPSTGEDDNDNRKKTTEIEEWDQKYMQVDQEMLFEIILVSAPARCPEFPSICGSSPFPSREAACAATDSSLV